MSQAPRHDVSGARFHWRRCVLLRRPIVQSQPRKRPPHHSRFGRRVRLTWLQTPSTQLLQLLVRDALHGSTRAGVQFFSAPPTLRRPVETFRTGKHRTGCAWLCVAGRTNGDAERQAFGSRTEYAARTVAWVYSRRGICSVATFAGAAEGRRLRLWEPPRGDARRIPDNASLQNAVLPPAWLASVWVSLRGPTHPVVFPQSIPAHPEPVS